MAACSIVIPTKNRPQMLRRAVLAGLQASAPDGEVVVIDDHSEVPASEVLADLGCARLRVVRNAGDPGAAGARNHGAAVAKGEILFFADDDDEIFPDYVGEIVTYARDRDAARFGFSLTVRAEDGQPHKMMRTRLGTGLINGKVSFRRKLCGAGEGFWVNREVFLSIGGFDPALRVDEDTDLCVRLNVAGYLPYYSSRPGMKIHNGHTSVELPGSQLTAHTSKEMMASCWLRTYEKSSAALDPLGGARWYLATRYMRLLIQSGETGRAMSFAMRQRPHVFSAALVMFCALKRAGRKVKPA